MQITTAGKKWDCIGFNSVDALIILYGHLAPQYVDRYRVQGLGVGYPPSHLGCSEGSWAGLVSSTSLRSLWASLRRSATWTWSFLRSTASMAASLRTALMKASRGSSVVAPEEPETEEEEGGLMPQTRYHDQLIVVHSFWTNLLIVSRQMP